MGNLFYILAGGALGALSRYALSGLSHKLIESTYPIGTLTVNLAGSFIIGLLFGLTEFVELSSNIRAFLFIGILGSFTTFSTYTLETLNLFIGGEIKTGFFNILYHNVFGLIFVFMGFFSFSSLIKIIK